ncbi:YciI family protein [Ruixingdingia sedimenti]|uniref:YciI family protein n=1 Tax=Ruixingdingia sedimenti TaxID=3073604 RepID=A0ABU1FEL6_9RHOB|nr:YciI family protein [Xinfangfangia sp. LG-4]MDR5654812.1 YciI family protein [Xinfangfangia sp. LG-4]
MPYMIFTQDVEQGAEIRKQHLDAHLAYLEGRVEILIASGGLLNEEPRAIGAVILINVDTREEAEDFVHNDPFYKAGLFKTLVIQRWRQFYLHGRPDRGPFAPLAPH